MPLMPNQQIKPEKITRPIQLLAAWLLGLVFIDASFLASARYLTSPSWIPAVLVVASVLNVPLFMIAIFVLQTRYRPSCSGTRITSSSRRAPGILKWGPPDRWKSWPVNLQLGIAPRRRLCKIQQSTRCRRATRRHTQVAERRSWMRRATQATRAMKPTNSRISRWDVPKQEWKTMPVRKEPVP